MLLRSHSLASFSHALTRDVVFVATGTRRAVLLDWSLPFAALDNFLTLCFDCHPLFSPLRLLCVSTPSSLDPAVFLINSPTFLQAGVSAPVLVDIDPSLPGPRLLPSPSSDALIAELRLCLSRVSAQLSSSPCQRLDISVPSSLPLPTLCGFLLSYPVVYTFSSALGPDPAPLPQTNSLSSHPLRLHSVYVHPTTHLQSLCPSLALPSHLCLSYTVPRDVVDDGQAQWTTPALDPHLFSHFSCAVTNVSVPHVSV